MAISVTKLRKPLYSFSLPFIYFSSPIHSISSHRSLEQSIKSAIESKTYQQIPDLLNNSNKTSQTSNPFSFLSNFPQHHTTKIINELLQTLLPLRPRSHPHLTYTYLLSFTLQSPNPLPLSLAILQRTLRSGCSPIPQTHLLLSSVWLHQRKQQNQTVTNMLSQMQLIGYRPDTNTCNYLISSLCKVDQFEEAIHVLKCMSKASCVPDINSFTSVISPLCDFRKTKQVQEIIKEMVLKHKLSPRKEMVVKVIKSMRANKEVDKTIEMINFLEEMNIEIGFESYELVIEMCFDSNLFVLAGKVALRMTNKGFIPYIKMRHKLFQELVNVGQLELAYIVKNRFTELNS